MIKGPQKIKDIINPNTFMPMELSSIRSSLKELRELKDFNLELLADCASKDETSKELLRTLLSREILIQVLESIQEGIQITDCDGNICYVNNEFIKITGLKKEERIGKNIFDVSADGSIATVLKTGKPVYNLRNNPIGTSVELLSTAAQSLFLKDGWSNSNY